MSSSSSSDERRLRHTVLGATDQVCLGGDSELHCRKAEAAYVRRLLVDVQSRLGRRCACTCTFIVKKYKCNFVNYFLLRELLLEEQEDMFASPPPRLLRWRQLAPPSPSPASAATDRRKTTELDGSLSLADHRAVSCSHRRDFMKMTWGGGEATNFVMCLMKATYKCARFKAKTHFLCIYLLNIRSYMHKYHINDHKITKNAFNFPIIRGAQSNIGVSRPFQRDTKLHPCT